MSISWFGSIKTIIKLSLSLCLASVIFCLYLIFTASGSQIIFSVISEMTPYTIHYDSFDGYLARQVNFKGLTIKGKNLYIHAKSLHSRWNIIDLFRPDKKIQTLEAHGFTLVYKGNKVPANSAHALLPFPFLVENLSLTDAHFEINEHQHDAHYLQLIRASSNSFDSIQEIHYQGTFGQLNVTLNQAIDANWALHFNNHPFFAPYLSGNIKSKGHIVLPKRKWRDPNNELQITIEGDKAHYEQHAIHDYTLSLEGTPANHRATLHGKFNAVPFNTRVKGKLSPSRWQGSIDDLSFERLEHSSGTLQLDWTQAFILAKLDLLLGNKHPVHADIKVKKNKSRSISGKITTQVKQLRSLSGFLPELRRVRGEANAEITLSGKLSHILVSSHVLLSNLKISTTLSNSKIMVETLQLNMNTHRDLTVLGQGSVGSGTFTINGQGSLNAKAPILNVHLKGQKLLLSDTPEYYIIGEPDLTFTIKNNIPTLEGKIFVPHAEIKTFKNPDTLSPSKDVVIVSHKKTDKKAAPSYSLSNQLRTNIDIVLGEKIIYTGYGFKTFAKGQLNIKQRPGQPDKAKGKITLVNGKYKAYGKKFDIAEGELLFTGGNIVNPTLNIRAERKIKTNPDAKSFHTQNLITAGMKFTGPLQTPHIEFYSSPPMSNADVISYLVTGQPQSNINHAQAEILFQALSHLKLFSGKQRDDVQFDLAEQLKLDQFGFSQKDNGTSSGKNPFEDTLLVLGKQLSDKLYLQYSVGLVDSSNTIGIKYFMSKHVTLEASTGTEGTSADLLLTFESGH